MEKNYLNEFSLRQSNIFDLRNIARELGVLSPTTYKKDELIAKILNIVEGNDNPKVPKDRKGRPPKSFLREDFAMSDIFDGAFNIDYQYAFNAEEENVANTKASSEWILSSPTEKDNFFDTTSNYGGVEYADGEGFLCCLNDNYYIFEKNKIASLNTLISVAKEMVVNCFLNEGDFICCHYKQFLSNGFKVAEKILSVNGNQDFTCNKQISFYDKPINYVFESTTAFTQTQNEFINQSGLSESKLGERNVILSSDTKSYLRFMEYLQTSNSLKDCAVVNIALGILPEEIELIKNNSFENFITSYSKTPKQGVQTLICGIKRAKRLAELGQNVVIIVNDLAKVVKYTNIINEYDVFDLKNRSLENFNVVLGLPRSFTTGKTVTLYSFLKQDNLEPFYRKLKDEIEGFDCKTYNY